MSVTVAAAAKKIAVYLATDKRTWKVVGTIIGIAIAIVLLPVMLLLAMENQLSSAETQSIDYSDYVQNLSAQQQSQLSQMESDGTAIADALTKLNLKNQIVKAQMLYLTYFDSVQKGENFFAEYADCFKESDDKKLIDSLNQKYGLGIDYTEFMRSYAVISNVSIDENWFLNLDVKNNIGQKMPMKPSGDMFLTAMGMCCMQIYINLCRSNIPMRLQKNVTSGGAAGLLTITICCGRICGMTQKAERLQ